MNPDIKKKVLRKIGYGIYILVAENNGEYAAATVTWLSQASFDPPLLMLGLKKVSNTYKTVAKTKKFSINFIKKSQKDMAAAFFKDTIYKDNKLNGYEMSFEESGIPVLKDVNSYLECEVQKIVEGGDHDIIIAKIKNAINYLEEDALNLSDTGWKYGG